MKKFFSTLLVVLSFCSMFSQTEIIPRSYIAYKTSEKIKIDGKAIESDWKNTEWSEEFVDIEGIKTPKYQTRFKMLWDKENMYFFVNIKEPHIWGTLKQRDTVVYYNNDFEIFIDPDGDTHNYYEFEVNVLNTVWDLFLTKPYREKNKVLNGWDIKGLQSAIDIKGTRNNPKDIDEEWNVEIAIPWEALQEAYRQDNIPRDDFWRINFSRVNWDFDVINGCYFRKKDENGKHLPEYNWVWSPQGIISMHEPETWGYVYFSTQKVKSNVRFVIPNDEKIKWHLYKAYKAQKKNQPIATTIIQGKFIQPNVEFHQSGWNVWVKSPFTNAVLLVREDGKFCIKNKK